MLDKVKAHIERNKTIYYTGGMCVIAGITCSIMRGRIVGLAYGGPYGLETADTSVTMRSLFSFFSKQTVFTIIQIDRKGPLSWAVRCLETREEFLSQRAAAFAKGISPSELSKHLNGGMDQVGGYTFERFALAG